jgi:prepilin-type N-terminal cleavage/methylation domain-containing protein
MSSIVTVRSKASPHQGCAQNTILKRSLSQFQGVTLIEVLVTAVLIGVFASILTPSFISWLNSRRMEDVTAQVESALKEAQAEAQKRSHSCAVNISPTSITATPSSCFPTGVKDLTKLGVTVLADNQSGTTLVTNLVAPAQIKVSHKGNISFSSPIPEAVITVFQRNGSTIQGRCVAISSGIGIMRRGKYVGQNPANPVPNACETIES